MPKLNKPPCRWCGKPCRPVYEHICVDCGHPRYLHPFQIKLGHCMGGNPSRCDCKNESADLKSPKFERKLLGCGINHTNLFCTNDCAIRWALKYAFWNQEIAILTNELRRNPEIRELLSNWITQTVRP